MAKKRHGKYKKYRHIHQLSEEELKELYDEWHSHFNLEKIQEYLKERRVYNSKTVFLIYVRKNGWCSNRRVVKLKRNREIIKEHFEDIKRMWFAGYCPQYIRDLIEPHGLDKSVAWLFHLSYNEGWPRRSSKGGGPYKNSLTYFETWLVDNPEVFEKVKYLLSKDYSVFYVARFIKRYWGHAPFEGWQNLKKALDRLGIPYKKFSTGGFEAGGRILKEQFRPFPHVLMKERPDVLRMCVELRRKGTSYRKIAKYIQKETGIRYIDETVRKLLEKTIAEQDKIKEIKSAEKKEKEQ